MTEDGLVWFANLFRATWQKNEIKLWVWYTPCLCWEKSREPMSQCMNVSVGNGAERFTWKPYSKKPQRAQNHLNCPRLQCHWLQHTVSSFLLLNYFFCEIIHSVVSSALSRQDHLKESHTEAWCFLLKTYLQKILSWVFRSRMDLLLRSLLINLGLWSERGCAWALGSQAWTRALKPQEAIEMRAPARKGRRADRQRLKSNLFLRRLRTCPFCQ